MRFLLAAFLIAACAPARRAPEVEFIPVPGDARLPDGSRMPFSDAVRVGHLLLLSGKLGTDSTGKLVPGGIGPETRQTLLNIKAALERNGSSLDKVVKCTAMLADMKEWPAMNEVYVTFFPDHLPARSAFGATALALGARMELECIAVVD